MNRSGDAATDSERLFLSMRCAISGRHAILEDDGFAVLLYLTESNDMAIAADCLAYSVVPPTEELVSPHGTGRPPILLQRYASDVALQPNVPAAAHRIEFSSDGHSVVLFVKDEPWALIARDERRGYSKSLSSACPFGQPWNQKIFDALYPI